MRSAPHRLSFTKFVATGNDFVFIDARDEDLTFGLSRSALAKRICDRHFGVGADGLAYIELSQTPGQLKWDFYNSDGSSAEMCGNASRCFGAWVKAVTGLPKAELLTVPGVVTTEIIQAGVTVRSNLKYLNLKFSELEFEKEGSKRVAMFVNTGVPHAVVELQNFDKLELEVATIQQLRFHPHAGPRGTNVTFIARQSPGHYLTTTFERGVEGFTLSCGTGVIAAAAVGLHRDHQEGKLREEILSVSVQSPAGTLRVEFGKAWQGASLEGDAKMVFKGELTSEYIASLQVDSIKKL